MELVSSRVGNSGTTTFLFTDENYLETFTQLFSFTLKMEKMGKNQQNRKIARTNMFISSGASVSLIITQSKHNF